jgi:LPS O-antigen subunit length determinant protein (WzzB/FepE family)
MQTKKTIIIAITVLLAVVALFFWYLIYQEEQTNNLIEKQDTKNKSDQLINQKEQAEIPEEEMRRALGLEKEEFSEIKTERGILENIDVDTIRVFVSEENKILDLKILNIKRVPIVRQVQRQEDGLFLNEEIEFQDLSLGKEVEIKYNENNNQLLMVTVLM